jgi:hypothetical protein
MLSQPLILIIVNLVLEFGVFLQIVCGFATKQWAVSWWNCGCEADCLIYIGLHETMYTQGKCGEYKTEDTECWGMKDNSDGCNSLNTAVNAGNAALATCVILFIYKIIVTILSFLYIKTHTKSLWFSMATHLLSDIFIGFAAFICAGQFDEAMDDFVAKKSNGDKVDFENGYGWKLMIGGGATAWICAILTAYILKKGLVPKEDSQPVSTNTV